MESTPKLEMPRYVCSKTVWALKIKLIERNGDDGSAIITPEESIYAPFHVSSEYMAKHTPHEGGYYVVYKDGYESFSPAHAFEEGYTPI